MNRTLIPDNYVAVKSALAGIEDFKPALKHEP